MGVKGCLECYKVLEVKEGKVRLNPRRKFCNHICSSRYNSNKKFNSLKNNKEYKKISRERFRRWYNIEGNKKRQNENVKRHYQFNKDKWNERKFVADHRDSIKQFINPLCSCGQPTKIFFHKQYGDVPILERGNMTEDKRDKNTWLLKQYTIRNLIGVCSQLCLHKEKRILLKEVAK